MMMYKIVHEPIRVFCFLEKESVFLTKREKRCRSVLVKRSIGLV